MLEKKLNNYNQYSEEYMLLAIMSSIQESVQKIRASLKTMEKVSMELKPTKENFNIMVKMKNNMLYIDDEVNKIMEICGYDEDEDVFSSSDEEDEEMLYRLWFFKNKHYILNMETLEVHDYETEKVIGMNVNGILIRN